jgi:predicted amidohydrolase
LNEKTVAAIALPDGVFASFQETLQEAVRSLTLAAAQGADLAVLPETINLLHRTSRPAPLEELALPDWREATSMVCEAASRLKIALVLPLLVREGANLVNRFYLLSKDGDSPGFYQKRVPALGEQAAGVRCGSSTPIHWEGLKVGGAICIDLYYPEIVFAPQLKDGVDLFVIPSLTPGGALLDACALSCGVPVILAYSPWSRILDRDGTQLAAGGYRAETLRMGYGSPVLLATINFDAVTLFADFNQEKMRDIAAHYGRRVRIRFSQHNCIFTLESRSPDLSVEEVMRQFGLVSRRDYLARLEAGADSRISPDPPSAIRDKEPL